jgi:protein-disulfide isomerase
MHDVLFENQDALEDEDLLEYAAALGLDVEPFAGDLAGHTHAARVRDDFLSGVRSGVNGTPTFFINGVRHDGPFDFDSLLEAIEGAMEAVTG